MSNLSLSELDLQRRAFGQYLNYLVNIRAKGAKSVITVDGEIKIDQEINSVGNRIKDVKIMIQRIITLINS